MALLKEKCQQKVAQGNDTVALIDVLQEISQTHQIKVIDVAGKWAELDAKQDVAEFIFGGKAETLRNLEGRLKSGTVLPQYYFSLADWKNNPASVITGIRDKFADKM